MVEFTDKFEIFIGCEVINEETFVEERAHQRFPFIPAGNRFTVDGYITRIGFNQIEYQAKKRGFTGSVIAYQPKTFALRNCQAVYIQDGYSVVYFCKI